MVYLKFLAVYIISKDYSPLISEIIQEEERIPKNILNAGLFEAVKKITSQKHVRKATDHSVVIDNDFYYINKYGDFSICVISPSNMNANKLADEVAWKFLRQFTDQELDSITNIDVFESCRSTLSEIINKYPLFREDILSGQIKELTPFEIFQLSEHLQETAKLVLVKGKTSSLEISVELNIEDKVAEENLDKLVDHGYLLKFKEEDKESFCYLVHSNEEF